MVQYVSVWLCTDPFPGSFQDSVQIHWSTPCNNHSKPRTGDGRDKEITWYRNTTGGSSLDDDQRARDWQRGPVRKWILRGTAVRAVVWRIDLEGSARTWVLLYGKFSSVILKFCSLTKRGPAYSRTGRLHCRCCSVGVVSMGYGMIYISVRIDSRNAEQGRLATINFGRHAGKRTCISGIWNPCLGFLEVTLMRTIIAGQLGKLTWLLTYFQRSWPWLMASEKVEVTFSTV